jgi:hypothetical protein
MQPLDYFFIGAFCGLMLGVLAVGIPTDRYWRKEALKRGLVRYNEKTGKLEWKE